MENLKIYLLTRKMQYYIENVVSKIFINLIQDDLKLISRFTILLIDIIGCKYNFKKENIDYFFGQISQNSDRDIISIMYLLLPYIDDKNSFELYKKITKLEDITCMKNINQDESINNYTICNYQFSRYFDVNIGANDNLIDDNYKIKKTSDKYYDYKYSEYDLEMSFKIVLSTIDRVSSKLYVNWINIIPITLEDYKETDKYKNSFSYDNISNKYIFQDPLSNEIAEFGFWNLDLKSSLRKYGGITADDVFNTIYIFLFNQIYNSGTKWLLYEKQINIKFKPKMFLEIIHDLIDINNFYEKNIYDNLDIKIRQSTEIKWLKLLNDAYNNIKSIDGEFIKCVIIKFDLKFCDQEIADNYDYDYTTLYEKITKNSLNDEDEFLDFNKLNDEYYEDFLNKINSFKKISFETIYEFFMDAIENFKLTWYGKQILVKKNEKIEINTDIFLNNSIPEVENNGKKYFVTYKNIYNYAKYISLPFKEKKKGTKIIDSRCLDLEWQKIFMNKLTEDNKDNKFNIKNVISKTYGDTPPNIINILQKTISTYFRENLRDIVFHAYIQAGLLNRFEIDSKITNEKLLGNSESERKKNIKKNLAEKFKPLKKKYLSTYYYLTGDKYENLDIYNKKNKKIDWFDFTFEENEPWFFSFAMNWVSQINFYNHFINNRVILVTGATGQGKSTEVPKLLYYALIAINLNFSARVVSTQPTIIPTKKNAMIIASNLGVPLRIGEYNTFSSYLQYSTQNEKHLVKGSKTYIKEVTDRTLFEEIIKNPYLKIQKKIKNGKIENSEENLYDIVIVDEAHMHNVNMDLILTFMRNVIHINNQIKLVITSATMDDDEYIYRRYYKIIDDNYGFPIFNKKVNFDFTDHNDVILDKIVVDRRYHISPPGQTTKYIVKDIYLDKNTDSYEDSELACLKILDEIIKKNITGDVLFFTTTKKNILRLVEYININSPSYVISLPLYSELRDRPGSWFETIENININLPNIVYEKSDILNVIENGENGFKKIQPNRYSLAIIVATNVVEASVTIPTLRFVIDTGYFLSVKYDSEKEDNSITVEKIPEASRLQRRGRVGRVASGTVYYGYAKNSRLNIKPRYGIAIVDITFDLFKILHGYESDSNSIYNPNFHPINYLYYAEEEKKKNNTVTSFVDFIFNEPNSNIQNIYINQYWIDIESGDDYSITNKLINPFNLYLNILESPYDDGYTLREIIDREGKFYIIHPDEEIFKREVVTGKIIFDILKNTKITDNIFISNKLSNSINKLQNIKYIYFDKIINNEDNEYIHLKKFKYFKIIDEIINKETDSISFLQKKFTEEDVVKIIKTICVSSSYKCTSDIIKIISLLYSIDLYKNFVSKHKYYNYPDYDNFINLWQDNISELFSYLKIMNFFIDKTKNNEIKKEYSKVKIETDFSKFIKIKKEYGNKIFIDKNILKEISDIKLYVEFVNNNYNSNKRYEIYNEKNKIKQEHKKNKIESYCQNMALNPNTIKNALILHEKLEKIVKKQSDKINIFTNFYPVFLGSKSENILKCFLESYLYSLSTSKNNKLINIIGNNEIDFPKVSLTYLPKNEILCFYCLKTKMGPIGLTIINKNLLEDIIPTKLLEIDEYSKLLNNDIDITKLTRKYQYADLNKSNDIKDLNKSNNIAEYKKSMNFYINDSLKIVYIKKYKLKKIN